MTKTNKKLNKLSPFKPLRVGLTGGIGSGKSFVLKCFHDLGFLTFNTDKAVHELLEYGNEGYVQISALYPDAADAQGINREILSNIIYQNPNALKQIEQVIHPLVRSAQAEFSSQHPNHTIIFEVPLLFENNRDDNFDLIICTHAPLEIRRKRALSRKGMTHDKFNAILQKQTSDKIRLSRAHYVIDTSGSKERTTNQIKALIENE